MVRYSATGIRALSVSDGSSACLAGCSLLPTPLTLGALIGAEHSLGVYAHVLLGHLPTKVGGSGDAIGAIIVMYCQGALLTF